MDLVLEYAYTNMKVSESGTVDFSKILIRLKIKKEYLEEISFMIGLAIPLTTAKENGPLPLTDELLLYSTVYREIYRQLMINSDKYSGDCVVSISIRILYAGGWEYKQKAIHESEKNKRLSDLLTTTNLEMFYSSSSSSIPEGDRLLSIPIVNKKKKYTTICATPMVIENPTIKSGKSRVSAPIFLSER
jgi:hypothetical protein